MFAVFQLMPGVSPFTCSQSSQVNLTVSQIIILAHYIFVEGFNLDDMVGIIHKEIEGLFNGRLEGLEVYLS